VAVHAFVDETRRGCRYYLVAAFVAPTELECMRKLLRGLLMPGQRELHFYKEKDRRRRFLADRIVQMARLFGCMAPSIWVEMTNRQGNVVSGEWWTSSSIYGHKDSSSTADPAVIITIANCGIGGLTGSRQTIR
jgi:hypothetical protein